jgi:hypothetical protein
MTNSLAELSRGSAGTIVLSLPKRNSMLYVSILAHGNYVCQSESQLVYLNLPNDSEVVISCVQTCACGKHERACCDGMCDATIRHRSQLGHICLGVCKCYHPMPAPAEYSCLGVGFKEV